VVDGVLDDYVLEPTSRWDVEFPFMTYPLGKDHIATRFVGGGEFDPVDRTIWVNVSQAYLPNGSLERRNMIACFQVGGSN
jgi:hypothetical protein